jgi:hypothetical protein
MCTNGSKKMKIFFSNLNKNKLIKIGSSQMKIYYRQGEFLHGLAVVYDSIYEIDQWWIGLTDLGMYQFSSEKSTVPLGFFVFKCLFEF